MITIYHSIIRYTPDLFRQEYLNIGLILLSPKIGYVNFKINEHMKTRLNCFDPAYSHDNLIDFQSQLLFNVQRVKLNRKSDNIFNLMHTLRNEHATSPFQFSPFQPTEMRTTAQSNITQHCHTLLEDLFSILVTPKKPTTEIIDNANLPNSNPFEIILSKHDLLTSNESKKGIHRNYNILNSASVDLTFSYGFKNGHHHLFENLDLSSKGATMDTLLKKAGGTYFKFLEAEDALNRRSEPMQLYTLMSGSVKTITSIRKSLQSLKTLTHMIHIDNADELNNLVSGLIITLSGEH